MTGTGDAALARASDPYHILSRKSCSSKRRSIACCRNIPMAREVSLARSARRCSRRESLNHGVHWDHIRPKRLQAIAREAVATYGDNCRQMSPLLSFKGIGAYTAGAIRSFAFRERAAILVRMWPACWFRVFIGKGVPKAHAMKKDLWGISAALVPRGRAFDFNQALMDFGATLCTARKPKCLICPMAPHCAAYPHNPENEQRP